MKKHIFKLSFLAAFAFMTSCTDLKEGVYDVAAADQFYATPGGAQAALADVYKEIRGDWGGIGIAGADRGWYDLNEACSDEMMIPRRSDGAWEDNGIWKQMYMHTWTAGQPFIENTWNWLYRAVFKANLAVELLTQSNADPAFIAEAKVLRAYFHYLLMDGWGSIPVLTSSKTLVKDVKQSTRQQVYDFVVAELTNNVDKLVIPTSTQKAGDYYNRFHKWVGYTLLAKVYMNAQVYTGTAKWTEALAACDKIIAEGGYSLISGNAYFSLSGAAGLFGETCNTTEVLFGIAVEATKAPRNIIGIRTLYGPDGEARFGFSTWNGATVHQDFVNKYENADIRKRQWLVGLQPGANYVLNISSFDNAGVQEGARNAKFLPVPPYNGGASSNDFPAYRYADILLMKAEAQMRLGQTANATTTINLVRARASASNFTTLTLDDIYDERGRELCWEGHRRQDMIRFGKFLLPHDFKTATSPNTYTLFPIPASALAANPTGLTQNPGY
jgi:hypothetical protein